MRQPTKNKQPPSKEGGLKTSGKAILKPAEIEI